MINLHQIDRHRTSHLVTKEYIVFSNEHGIFTKLGHIPGNEIIPKLILKNGHLQSMSPDDTRIHLERSNNTLPG